MRYINFQKAWRPGFNLDALQKWCFFFFRHAALWKGRVIASLNAGHGRVVADFIWQKSNLSPDKDSFHLVHSRSLTACPWKMMVGRRSFSFWDGIFSGAMLNFQGVYDFLTDTRYWWDSKLELLLSLISSFFEIIEFPHFRHLLSSLECFLDNVGTISTFQRLQTPNFPHFDMGFHQAAVDIWFKLAKAKDQPLALINELAPYVAQNGLGNLGNSSGWKNHSASLLVKDFCWLTAERKDLNPNSE